LKPWFCGDAMCQLDTHIDPKSGEESNHFSQPRYVHARITPYPMSTSGRSPITLAPSLLSPSHFLPPVPPRSTSPPSHYTSSLTCVAPTLSSVSSSHPQLSTWPSPVHYSHAKHTNHFVSSHVHCQTSPQASDSDLDGRM
jgi:hypothetical protein